MKLPLLFLMAAALAAPAAAQSPSPEGCYFGVCPDAGAPAPAVQPQTDAPLPAETGALPWQPPQVQPAFPQQAQYSGLCTTPGGVCFMDGVYPVGNGCWCPGLVGPIMGIVMPE